VKTESDEWQFWQEAHLAARLSRTLATQCHFIGIYHPVVHLIPLLMQGEIQI